MSLSRNALGHRTVSALGFGASPLGGVFGPVTQNDADRAVRVALDLGVDLFDTAPFYGIGRSEEVLGRALSGVPRDRFFLTTKVGRYGPTAYDYSAERVVRSIDESLARLGVDHVDLLLCHDCENAPEGQIVAETLPALRTLVDSGKTRAVGFSGLPLALFPEILDHAQVDVALSYCHACLNDDALLGLMPYLEAKGVGIINASPLAMGLLTDDGPPEWHPAPEPLKRACARAAVHCREKGASLAALALAWSVRLPGIATTLVGMADEATVRANVAAFAQEPDPELLAEVLAILAPVHNVTWPSGR